MMLFRVLADLVVVLHLSYVVFVVLGGILAVRSRPLLWAHLPAATWGALISFLGWTCPLTLVENWLLRQSGAAGYESGFIEHYLVAVLYPQGLTQGMQIALGVGVIVVNLWVYWRFVRTSDSGAGSEDLPALEVRA